MSFEETFLFSIRYVIVTQFKINIEPLEIILLDSSRSFKRVIAVVNRFTSGKSLYKICFEIVIKSFVKFYSNIYSTEFICIN